MLPAAATGAVEADLPATLRPQLATLAERPPESGDWLYEIKFDGYRILARVSEGRVRLTTRRGHDWTSKLTPLARAVRGLGLRSAWLDGEIVVLDESGVPVFNALQNAFDSARTQSIRYFLFDLPYFDGYDLRAASLRDRRSLLQQLLAETGEDKIRFSASLPGEAADVLRSACDLGLEGIIAKRADSPYVSKRTATWLKLKCSGNQEFVVVGYTDRAGSRSEIGSLLLGSYREDGQLAFAGAVGTGWDAATARALKSRLERLEVPKSALAAGVLSRKGRWSRRSAGVERWVRPTLVAQVSFSGFTPDGSVRHASFRGLRLDKPVKAVVRETVLAASSTRPKVRGIGISNPDRIIDPGTGLRKLDLVRYYERVAAAMLPHLAGRPVSLVRGPTGVEGQLFFQKHAGKLDIPGIRKLDPALWPGHEALLEISSVEGLIGAAQMNVIEFHTGNASLADFERPDRIVFDLDPGEGVTWAQLQEGALLTRAMLKQLGLQSWLKTSGGKGLHLVVPLTPQLDFARVKAFSKAVVEHLARTLPSRFVAKSGSANRIGRIYVDYVRNGQRATTVAAFSARARPGLGVSMPVSWAQLPSLESGAHWTISTAQEHLVARRADPWRGYWKERQTLAGAMAALGGKPTKRRSRS